MDCEANELRWSILGFRPIRYPAGVVGLDDGEGLFHFCPLTSFPRSAKFLETKGKGKKMEICVWTDCCLCDVTYNDRVIMMGVCPECGHECDFGEGEEIPDRD